MRCGANNRLPPPNPLNIIALSAPQLRRLERRIPRQFAFANIEKLKSINAFALGFYFNPLLLKNDTKIVANLQQIYISNETQSRCSLVSAGI